MQLKILVGTVTGNAMSVAQAIELACTDLMADIAVVPMDGLDIGVFTPDALFLVCTSTTGAGDVPDNAQALYASLLGEPRYLGGVRYGVLALGDAVAHAATFAEGGLKFDAALQDLGARRIGEVFTHDACGEVDAETAGVDWCRGWLAEALATPPGAPA
ncbi:flavodoxin domain-containing protein [Pseudorhodoferax sp.]|uniref:flavodoxin domain-containing protein n=1 Tax=Pseudorhodoferax sp. TaxID=1993553 RepID=UPI002DD6AB64|nr:flavodoxin domain-containing protein [Pseudorhodoferax sp.]